MKKQFVLILVAFSALLLLGVIISDQQLLNYAKQHNVLAQMNLAGNSGSFEPTCRNFHLPWSARQFDVFTPLTFVALLFLTGILILRKKLQMSRSVTQLVLVCIVIEFAVIIYYQLVDPFYPFVFCRGWI